MKLLSHFRALLVVLSLVFAAKTSAQIYPVQISTQLLPPYSGYLADYADPLTERMRVLLQLNDLTQLQYAVRLKIVISGNGFTLSTKATFNPPPLILLPAFPHLLSGSELAPYLSSANLDFSGFTQQQYEQWQRLPEGYYSICITAYDHWNPAHMQLSNEACASAWFMLNDPPLLNLPQCGTQLTPSTPQQLTFSWTPLHMASPYSPGTEYDFELYEIRPEGTDPNVIVQNSPPVYQTSTALTLLNYGITEPPLNTGFSYAWRVRARDAGGRDLFRNNGWSAVCTFAYGSPASTLGNAIQLTLQAQGLSHRQGRCWWNGASILDQYLLQVRKQGYSQWFDFNTAATEQKVNDLEPVTTYEARLKGSGPGGIETDWSAIVAFTTGPSPQYNCNESNILPDLLQAQPLLSAQPGMIFKTGQFEMTVKTIQATGPPGWFSGSGQIRALGPLTLEVQFLNVFVNDNHTVTQGTIVAMSDGIDQWLSQWEQLYTYDESFLYSGDIDSVYIDENGNLVIVDANGNTSYVSEDYDGGLLITDSNGDQWIVNPDGTITYVTGGYLPLTTVPLTPEELDILKKALQFIRAEFDPPKLAQLTQNLQQQTQSFTQHANQQQQALLSGTANNVTLEEYPTLFAHTEKSAGAMQLPAQQLNYRNAEIAYNEGRLLARFSREANSDQELNFIGQYLSVGGKPFKIFVAEELAKNRTPDAIAVDAAANGIKPLAKQVVRKKMTKNG